MTSFPEIEKSIELLPSTADDPSFNPPKFLRTTVSPITARMILAVVAALYGTNFGCVKLLEHTLSPALTATARFGLASAALLPLAIATRPNKRYRKAKFLLIFSPALFSLVNAITHVFILSYMHTVW